MSSEINEIKGLQNDNPILDIVNTIQSKLNENNTTKNNIETTNNQNDLSGLDISKMLDMLKTTSNNTTNTNLNDNKNSNLNLDLGTILKFQNVLTGFNKADPRKDLLTSLKPFLRETRQKNIDTYITLLGIMKAFNSFSNKDRD